MRKLTRMSRQLDCFNESFNHQLFVTPSAGSTSYQQPQRDERQHHKQLSLLLEQGLNRRKHASY